LLRFLTKKQGQPMTIIFPETAQFLAIANTLGSGRPPTPRPSHPPRREGAMSEAFKHNLRCKVYTCKSTDQGLDQEYNLADTQRNLSQVYITSQRSWC
jgi:hypothetical protein